jgi:ribosomal protein S18 acetylase RimI-like enzyme
MTNEPILIGQATVDDAPFLRAMMWEALLASPTFLAHQDMEVLERHEEQEWAKWREHPDPAFIALDAEGRSVGAIRLRPHSAEGTEGEQGWQIGIGIEADARHKGIGRSLIEHAISFAHATNAAYLYLLVDPTNSPAIALYRRTGFVEIGEREHLIEMRLSLSEYQA